ncbi:hypothetical protein BJ741DRAFT_628778 [Chytriomyces cf. hyalinus JEL632]|nr:hypothetical protein BJ741DRAFT_628778 [Chytriomyces cf. hyalinus JEL632]
MASPTKAVHDIATQYIAALEDKLEIDAKLRAAYVIFRRTEEKCHAAKTEVEALTSEALLLKQRLEARETGIGQLELLEHQNKALTEELVALRAKSAAGVVNRGEPARLGSVNGSAQNIRAGSETGSTKRDTPDHALAGKRISKRFKQDDFTSLAAASISPSDGKPTSAPSHMSDPAVSADVKTHVIKSSSNEEEVQCRYCLVPIPRRHQSRWIQHIVNCDAAPDTAKRMLSSPHAYTLIEGRGTPSVIIDEHVTKQGSGRTRTVHCNYCTVIINSEKRKDWERHMYSKCTRIPLSVKQAFENAKVALTTKSATTPSVANDTKTPEVTRSRTASSEGAIKSLVLKLPAPPKSSTPVSMSPPKFDDDLAEPLQYPTEPPEFLPDGTRNTLRFRAWVDIIRYQRPNHVVVNASRLKLTTFKRNYKFPVVRLMPETGFSKFSSGCFAIPENMHRVFLSHFDEEPSGKKPTADVSPIKISNEVESTASNDHKARNEVRPESPLVPDPIASDSLDSSLKLNDSNLHSDKKPVSSKNINGTRYVNVIREIMPDFPTLPADSRKAVKRGVRLFLEAELKYKFSDCVIVKGGGTMYMIPDELMDAFKDWAFEELSRCFPGKAVMLP